MISWRELLSFNLKVREMSEKEREDKQRYLRENILDRDYDAEEFMDFCENYKGSMDIDSWTLN